MNKTTFEELTEAFYESSPRAQSKHLQNLAEKITKVPEKFVIPIEYTIGGPEN